MVEIHLQVLCFLDRQAAMEIDTDAAPALEVAEGGGGALDPASSASPGSIFNYVVTAHKPTAVSMSVVGAFTGPNDTNLIIA